MLKDKQKAIQKEWKLCRVMMYEKSGSNRVKYFRVCAYTCTNSHATIHCRWFLCLLYFCKKKILVDNSECIQKVGIVESLFIFNVSVIFQWRFLD